MSLSIPKITAFKTVEAFRAHLASLQSELTLDDAILGGDESPLAQPLTCYGRTIGNRWAILPMEGWDCLPDGSPSELTRRRWHNFGRSGAKLLFGCEAAAVMPSGKSNTRQLMITEATTPALGGLLREVRDIHRAQFGRDDDLLAGLQLTHSGRYSHPHDDHKLEPVTAYAHPMLDRKFGCTAAQVVGDDEVQNIIAHFIRAARLARDAGFDFVDVKMAHGYLGFEFLRAIGRPGPYGGSFENRTRFFREIVEGIRRDAPGIEVATRLSLFDYMPFEKGPDGVGRPMTAVDGIGAGNYPYAFGGDGTGVGIDLGETVQFLEMARTLGVELICTTCGSPYYNPHIQRPAYFPVCDGYLPPEDPVLGAARQIAALAAIKGHFKDGGLCFVGSGYTCLQEFLVQTAQRAVREGRADCVGIGRMALSYPEMCADTLGGKVLNKRRICRTFGDCTTAPRNGMVSGCYPLDEFYKGRDEAGRVREIKAEYERKRCPAHLDRVDGR